jgi:hypothetical protein
VFGDDIPMEVNVWLRFGAFHPLAVRLSVQNATVDALPQCIPGLLQHILQLAHVETTDELEQEEVIPHEVSKEALESRMRLAMGYLIPLIFDLVDLFHSKHIGQTAHQLVAEATEINWKADHS